MSSGLRTSSNFWTALLFLVMGVAGAILATRYDLGQLRRLGPGAFPFAVALILALIGLCLLLKSLRDHGPDILGVEVASLLAIGGALLIAGLTVRSLGIVVAVPAAVVVSSLAAGDFKPVRIAAMAVGLTLFCYLVFILGLGIQLPVYPGQF